MKERQRAAKIVRRWLTFCLLLLLSRAWAAAGDSSCPAEQNEALGNIVSHCADQAAETLCFGHPTVSALQRELTSDAPNFTQPGDTMSIAGVDWLSVSTEDRSWGLARAIFPAYAYDSLEAEETALLAFGNVALFFSAPVNLPSPLHDVEVAASRGAYLRAEPSLAADIVKPISVRAKVKAIGTSLNRNWLRVYAAPDMLGWMSREVLTEPAERLPVSESDADTVPLWLPWQSFDFRSGIGDAPCADAPESGILLQTPKFIPPRQFLINGIRLRLSGSAWLQATLSSGTRIRVLDGLGHVRAADIEQEVKSGFGTSVPLVMRDDDGWLMPAEAPSEPAAYDYHAMLNLPVGALIYPSRIRLDVYTVAEPVPAGGGNPLEGLSGTDDCAISAGLEGANIRSRPDPEAPIIAVMAYRESAKPIARGIGADGLPWWKLADSVWIRIDVTAFAGNCGAIPLLRPGS